jgi:hypothetical protein
MPTILCFLFCSREDSQRKVGRVKIMEIGGESEGRDRRGGTGRISRCRGVGMSGCRNVGMSGCRDVGMSGA